MIERIGVGEFFCKGCAWHKLKQSMSWLVLDRNLSVII